MIRLLIPFVVLLAGVALPLRAGETEPKVIRLTVHPAAPPSPALKYRLLPDVTEQTVGNSATLYLIAMDLAIYGVGEEARQNLEVPLAEMDLDQVRQTLRPMRSGLHQIGIAARRTYADWGHALREEGYAMLLPHLSPMQAQAQSLSLLARLHHAEADSEQALRTMQSGFAMGRHVSQDTVVLQGLVANGIISQFLDRVHDWVEVEDSANLYWALADLPRPFIDVRALLEREDEMFYATFPELTAQDLLTLTELQWRTVWARFDRLPDWFDEPPPREPYEDQARQHLLDLGLEPAEVQAMPADQVLGIYFVSTYRQQWHDLQKWSQLPYWQAADHLQELRQRIGAGQKQNPFFMLLPHMVDQMYARFTDIDRRIAVLQTIEAVRAYAASHGGQLPQSLEAISDTPAPIDPMTGRLFGYTADGETFILDAPAPPGYSRGAVRYEVTVVGH